MGFVRSGGDGHDENIALTPVMLSDDRPSPGRWFREHDWRVTAISQIQAAARYGRPLGESAGDIAKGTLLTARLP